MIVNLTVIPIPLNYSPLFVDGLPISIPTTVNWTTAPPQTWIYTSPVATDPEGDTFTMSFNIP